MKSAINELLLKMVIKITLELEIDYYITGLNNNQYVYKVFVVS